MRQKGSSAIHCFVQWACPVLCCLIAFGLYFRQLAVKPLWWDEGFSIYVASLSPFDLIRATAADVHPPAYYLLLRGWIKLVGPAPFAVRSFSVLTGVLLVPLLYASGRRVNGKPTGVLAALLGTVAPFVFHYARECRMYSLGMVLVAVSTYAFLRILTGSLTSCRWWVLYIVSVSLGLYTQYAFAVVPVAQAVTVLISWRQKTGLKCWVIAAIVVLVAWFPWVIYAGSQLHTLQAERIGYSPSLNVIKEVLPVFRRLVVGYASTEDTIEALAVGSFTLLMLVGAIDLSRRRSAARTCVPLGVVGAVLVATVVHYTPEEGLMRVVRLAFPAVPLLTLLVAVGAGHIFRAQRWGGTVALMLIMVCMGRSILVSYKPSANISRDYRPLIAQMRELVQPGDAALTAYVWQDGYFTSYASDLPLTFYRNAYNAQNVSGLLGGIFDSHHRLWVVNYLADVHDVTNPFNAWLHRHAALAFDVWYGNTQLSLFTRASNPPVVWLAQTAFERDVTLDYVPLTASVRPGDTFSLDLRWQAGAPLERPWKIFVHTAQPGSPPIAQSDHEPANGLEPTNTWLPGRSVVDRRAVLVPSNALPGVYMIYVGVYDPLTSVRLSVAAPSGCDTPDSACVGRVEILDGELFQRP